MLRFGIMTLNQLESLTEDELCLCLYIVNVTFPVECPKMEFTPRQLTWLKHDALVKKLTDAFPRLKHEAHPIYSSLLTKLGIQHQIKYEQPQPPVSGSI